jgi:hypothetical protein
MYKHFLGSNYFSILFLDMGIRLVPNPVCSLLHPPGEFLDNLYK